MPKTALSRRFFNFLSALILSLWTKKRRKVDLNPKERFIPFYHPMSSITLNVNNIKCIYTSCIIRTQLY